MTALPDPFTVIKEFPYRADTIYYSLPALAEQGVGDISSLPVSIRIMLESLLRNLDGTRVTEQDVRDLASWDPHAKPSGEVPFVVSRVILQDFTGVPLLVDLAAMRDAVAKLERPPGVIEPRVPVDLVIDHSVQVDRAGTEDAFQYNLSIEFARNRERYAFLKWGQQAFSTFRVVPPGIGIVHQVNLELIASVVAEQRIEGKTILLPDSLVGTDSHTTMINGLGVVGWGVGGIEAEAAMLGQPIFLQPPEVIGVHIHGSMQEGVTATDLALRVTELLRAENVVGKFVEFFGEGAASLTVADRATIANMAPEYGATMGFFPSDEKTLDYLRLTGRKEEHVQLVERYLKEQGLFGISSKGQLRFTKELDLDLSALEASISGPKRPQDRINVRDVKQRFDHLLQAPTSEGGYGQSSRQDTAVCVHPDGFFSLQKDHETGGKSELNGQKDEGEPYWKGEAEMVTNRPLNQAVVPPGYSDGLVCNVVLRDGSIVIAAITSCTNTSNPSVMVAAGLLAKKAVEKGLKMNPMIKTSLAPGSRVVTDYLEKAGLQDYLDELGFNLVAYGCTTCIGNSGPLDETIDSAIHENDLIVASVLSGNRNFEARVHSSVKANFLMSPPLVVAYALAGTIDKDLTTEPIGYSPEDGSPVFLKDIWPSHQEIHEVMTQSLTPEMFTDRYSRYREDNPLWDEVEGGEGELYDWDEASTYIRQPPYFDGFTTEPPGAPELKQMRALALFGDSVTTDHISPAGAFSKESPAGQYLMEHGVEPRDFNSYGSRRGNDR